MSQAFFVDSWFFIARLDHGDSDHARAQLVDRKTAGTTVSLVTHDGVLTEVLAFFAKDGMQARQRVAATMRTILDDRRYTVGRLSDLFETALDLYERRPDKGFSLTDYASMVLMRRLSIDHVLTNDHHFRQEGFVVVNE